MRLPAGYASVVLAGCAVACSEFATEPAKAVAITSLGWPGEIPVTDVETLKVEVPFPHSSAPVTGTRVRWQSHNDALLSVVQLQPRAGASREDTLVAQLKAVATGRAGGLATVSVLIESGGAFEPEEFSDTIRVTQKWKSVSAGYEHSCGVTVDDAAYCWGSGFIGDGSAAGSSIPARLKGDLRFRSVSAGNGHTCGVLVDGTAYCWGLNDHGEIGNGTKLVQLSPVPVSAGRTFEVVSAGANHTCGLSGGSAFCWGSEDVGQLGDAYLDPVLKTPVPLFDNCAPLTGNLVCSMTPRPVRSVTSLLPLPFSALAPGELHTCGIVPGGAAVCWGDPGKLGNSTLMPSDAAFAVAGGLQFKEISSGALHACAITSAGSAAFCWGFDHRGQLGSDGVADASCSGLPCSLQPVPVSSALQFRTISAGGLTTCGVATDSSAYCWGSNESGQLGNDTASAITSCQAHACSRRPVKVQIKGDPRIISLDVGLAHVCGVTSGGAAYCWGAGAGGRLGNGSSGDRPVPARVHEPDP
jgi:alpha-tubulin suppressor-like RCC1 family protein